MPKTSRSVLLACVLSVLLNLPFNGVPRRDPHALPQPDGLQPSR